MKQCIRCGGASGDMFRVDPNSHLPGIANEESGWCHSFDALCWAQVRTDRHNLEFARNQHQKAQEQVRKYKSAEQLLKDVLENLQKIQESSKPNRLKVILSVRKFLGVR